MESCCSILIPRCGRCHADTEGVGGATSLCSCSSRSRSRAAMNRVCRPSYSSSRALASAVSWPKRRRVSMSSRCVRRNLSDRATRSSASSRSLDISRVIGDTVPRAGDCEYRTSAGCRCRNFPCICPRYHQLTVRSRPPPFGTHPAVAKRTIDLIKAGRPRPARVSCKTASCLRAVPVNRCQTSPSALPSFDYGFQRRSQPHCCRLDCPFAVEMRDWANSLRS